MSKASEYFKHSNHRQGEIDGVKYEHERVSCTENGEESEWWNWGVWTKEPDGESPVCDGVSYISEAEAAEMARAVAEIHARHRKLTKLVTTP